MTQTVVPPPSFPPMPEQPSAAPEPIVLENAAPPAEILAAESSLPLAPTLVAAGLAATAAAWVAGGVFRDPMGRFLGLIGVALAIGLVVLGNVIRRPALAQLLTAPAAAVVGALLVLPDARGGSATLPSLVGDAIRSGGLLQPPLSLDPGWRFILVVLAALVTAAAVGVAVGTGRPRLAVVIPGAVVVLASLVQPDSAEIVSAVGGIVLLAGALAAAYGSQLGKEGAIGRDFELNRLIRGGGLALLLVAGVAALSRTGVLFPQPNRDRVVPAQRPQQAPPVPDRVLFTARLDNTQVKPTYRQGVIDVYQSSGLNGGAWLLPEYDSRLLKDLHPQRDLPDPPAGPGTYTATITMADAQGHDLPTPGGARELKAADQALQFNPRSTTIRLRDRPSFRGLSYTVTASLPPSGAELANVAPPPDAVKSFLAAPPEPSEVVTLLAKAPTAAFARLQFVRTALYSKVVAAGEGKPVDVSPNRVAEMLDGKEASPYEITAAEALLARWAGVPARIAFGYYGGNPRDDGGIDFRPAHGATWMEAYFKGYGWVPIVGVPPRAKASLSETEKNSDPSIQPADDLALIVYVPVEVVTLYRFYQVARFYVLLVTPVLLLLVLAVVGFPALMKWVRRWQRGRWGRRHGVRGRVAVAYSEFRDAAHDLAIGDPGATPLAFLRAVDPDREHSELAWLVTRVFWGDLRRDLQAADAAAAEELAASVTRRMRRAQPLTTRLLALVARASLRQPYTREVPNPWPRRQLHLPRLRRSRKRRRLVLAPVAVLTVVMGSLGMAQPGGAKTPSEQLASLLPPALEGLTIQRELTAEKAFKQAGALVHDGQVYTIHHDDVTEGSIQLSLFRSDVDRSDRILHQLEDNIGSGRFRDMTIPLPLYDGNCFCAGRYHDALVSELPEHGYQDVKVMVLPDQRVYLWFPKHLKAMALVVVRRQFTVAASDALVLDLIDHELGHPLGPIPVPAVPVQALPVPSPNSGLAP